VPPSPSQQRITRRRFLSASAYAAAGVAVYSGEIERHWIEISHHDAHIPGLPAAFDGIRVVQLSDIHLDEFTEPFFLREAVKRINEINPDLIFLTGDYVTRSPISNRVTIFNGSVWQCANILNELKCRQRYGILGNHDYMTGEDEVIAALTDNGIQVLRNAYLPIERAGGRFWLAGVDDPVFGNPDSGAAIPKSIRNIPNEPVVLLCHAPDYVDDLLTEPEAQAVALMLSGHTHGGQIRLPFFGPFHLPVLGRKYVRGWFRFGNLQLYVNRGLGTVDLPFRFHCPPEITVFTLRTPGSTPSQV
jgi:uncharacterized protein